MPSRTIVLDTNVLISAALKEGSLPAQLVVHLLRGNIVLVTCPSIVNAYLAVFHRPKFSRWRFPPAWLDRILDAAFASQRDPPLRPLPGPDADDLVFLSLARQQGATLVTGNMRHYPTAIRRDAEVVTPAEYLSWLDTALG